MSDCMYNSDYICGKNPKGGCWNCDTFKELDKFIIEDGSYVRDRGGDICIDGAIFRKLADDYIKIALKKAKSNTKEEK